MTAKLQLPLAPPPNGPQFSAATVTANRPTESKAVSSKRRILSILEYKGSRRLVRLGETLRAYVAVSDLVYAFFGAAE